MTVVPASHQISALAVARTHLEDAVLRPGALVRNRPTNDRGLRRAHFWAYGEETGADSHGGVVERFKSCCTTLHNMTRVAAVAATELEGEQP